MPGRRITADAPPPIIDQPPTAPPQEPSEGTVLPEEESRRLVGPSPANKLTELQDAERVSFATLLACGQMSDEINVMDHTVVIENLDTNDDLMVGMFTKDFVGTDAYQRAWQLATVACGIRTIDTRPVYTPLVENATDQHMFDETVKRLGKYRPVVITEIYRAILALDVEFEELREKLGKQNG